MGAIGWTGVSWSGVLASSSASGGPEEEGQGSTGEGLEEGASSVGGVSRGTGAALVGKQTIKYQ